MNILGKIYKQKQGRIRMIPAFIACFVAVILSSCSNELPRSDVQGEDGDYVTLEFQVPRISFSDQPSTKADEGSTDISEYNQEGWFANLYLIIIKDPGEDESANRVNVYELDTSGYNQQVGDDKEPSKFYVNLYPGSYKFYMVANFDRYLERFSHISGIQNEEEVKDIVLNFTADMPLVPSHLPMAAEPVDFTLSASSTTGMTRTDDGKITIPEKPANSTATRRFILQTKLHFLCAKVRYTILYNNTPNGCSEMFGNNSIRFVVNQSSDRPKAKRIRKQTRFYTNRVPDNFDKQYFYIVRQVYNNSGSDGSTGASSTPEQGYWPLEISRYNFPTDANGNPDEGYPHSSSDKLTPYQDQPNLSGWKASRQRAWQGVVYLPENDVKKENEDNSALDPSINTIRYNTYLEFPYVLEKYVGEDGNYVDVDPGKLESVPVKTFQLFEEGQVHYGPDYTTEPITGSEGLKRGSFYDVVALVKNPSPDDLEMYIQVYVGDHPWIYHNNGEQTW